MKLHLLLLLGLLVPAGLARADGDVIRLQDPAGVGSEEPVVCVDWTSSPAPTPMLGSQCSGFTVQVDVVPNPDGTVTILVTVCANGQCSVHSIPLPVDVLGTLRYRELVDLILGLVRVD